MNRKLFLTIAGAVGVLVGLVALGSPATILVGKGVVPEPATMVWVREVGSLILASSALVLVVRKHEDSATMRAVLVASGAIHGLLLPIEVLAWRAGVLTRLVGIVPNSLLHCVFAGSFVYFAVRSPTGAA